jgi:hypothetical protein
MLGMGWVATGPYVRVLSLFLTSVWFFCGAERASPRKRALGLELFASVKLGYREDGDEVECGKIIE